MSVSLVKGQRINLRKDAPNLKRVLVGLGWDPISGHSMDIDASVICIDGSGREKELVYFGHKIDSAHSIKHHGDNLTGAGDGDDEQIDIWLDKVPANVERLSIIINIYSAYSKRQDFGQVQKSIWYKTKCSFVILISKIIVKILYIHF